MIMNSGNFESVLDRRGHDRRDFAFKQDQITHHHRAATAGFESRPSTERECRLYDHAVQRYAQIGSRKAVPMNIARYSSRASKRIIDFFPVNFLSCSAATDGDRSGKNK